MWRMTLWALHHGSWNAKTFMAETIDITARLTRIRFRNEENQYTVADCVPEETQTSITVVGYLMGIKEGDTVAISGVWEKHAKYGQQFTVKTFETLLPTTIEGIRHFLKALDVKGLSPKKIGTLLKSFRENTLTIIDTEPDSLIAVKGIGKVLGERIVKAWERRNDVRKLMAFLQENAIPPSFSSNIYRKFGGGAVDVITRNPYSLSFEFPDMPFIAIDAAARNMGVDRNDPQRVAACILHLLELSSSNGHVFGLKAQLADQCSVRFGIDPSAVEAGFDELTAQNRIVPEPARNMDGETAVYSRPLHRAETGIASTLLALNALPMESPYLNKEDIIEEVLKNLAIQLSEEQLEVLENMLSHRVVIITGGPGTGKTTLVRSVTAIFKRLGKTFLLAAPTGRAARRLSEVTGEEASTIHKMLQYNIGTGGFDRNRNDPLDADAVIVDEASMVDILLMHSLVSAVPFQASLIVVGDIFQLPSVGPGTVLSDLIHSGCFKTFELTRIFRQAQESPIIMNSHRVRYGKEPKTPEPEGNGLSEFYFIETSNPVTVMERVVELCTRRIPEKYGFDPMTGIQVLTPMHKGDVGTLSLNAALQAALNPKTGREHRFNVGFRPGDKVMHLKNNYEKEVFNGDIGIIEELDSENKVITVNYDGRSVEYDAEELHELSLAYAISVHKSQGSEYPAVVVPITTQHYPLLQRNLLYTAMTRGKKLVILIGTKRALTIALENDRPRQRLSGLKDRLTRYPE
jgi:exodeoxyribonuclease V alpha subunit